MIHNLQALRALAAWMVVIHHLRAPLGLIWPPLGETLVFAAGVDIFFVLSGYVMVASTRGRDVSPAVFIRRRLVRIAPLYWAVTAALVLMLLVGLSPVGVDTWRFRDIVGSFLFLGVERSDGYPGPLLGVGWTLAYEAFFYALFGLSLLARAKGVMITIAALIVLVALGKAISPDAFAARFYTAPILLEFVFGAGLAHLKLTQRGGAMLAAGFAGLAVGGAVLAAVAPTGDLITPGGAGAAGRAIWFGVPATLIVAGAISLERTGAICRSRFALDQGDASYALYLIHLPLIQIIEKAVGTGPAVLLVAPPVLTFAALHLHQAWERPVLIALQPRRFDLRAYRLAG